MKLLPSPNPALRSRLARAGMVAGALAVVLAGALPAAATTGTLEKARQRGALKVGMHYVAPEYVAGSKFRTPETIEHALAQDLAKHLGVKAITVRGGAAADAALPSSRKADLLLALAPSKDVVGGASVIVPTGYVAAPMAIMRTDTTIKSWEQLKGRTVCVPEGGRYAGLAARHGAIELPYKAPADALLGLRIGTCDATIHDAALLEELLRLPEWKKFSARLQAGVGPGASASLAFVLPAGDEKARAYVEQVAREWQSSGALQQHLRLMARNIAFEVYLDQDVPDCH